MFRNAHDAYLENRVMSADPLELVRMLYAAAVERVGEARRHLATGDIAARSRAISKATEVIAELDGSLDHTRGGELSRRLQELYTYMRQRLLEANFRQEDSPLAEVAGLLSTLMEAWQGVDTRPEPARRAAEPEPVRHWGFAAEPAPAHAWSF